MMRTLRGHPRSYRRECAGLLRVQAWLASGQFEIVGYIRSFTIGRMFGDPATRAVHAKPKG